MRNLILRKFALEHPYYSTLPFCRQGTECERWQELRQGFRNKNEIRIVAETGLHE